MVEVDRMAFRETVDYIARLDESLRLDAYPMVFRARRIRTRTLSFVLYIFLERMEGRFRSSNIVLLKYIVFSLSLFFLR